MSSWWQRPDTVKWLTVFSTALEQGDPYANVATLTAFITGLQEVYAMLTGMEQ